MHVDALIAYCDDLLNTKLIKDYAPNGLQVAGKETIKKLVSGVTACQALIDKAIAENADALLVHHGYFWRNEDATITGIKRNRVAALIENNINLIAYHLPLDVHPSLGNNAQLADRLDIDVLERHKVDGITDLVFAGELRNSMPADEFAAMLNTRLKRDALHVVSSKPNIKTLAWCTGGAQKYLDFAIKLGVDAYITGEVSEASFHIARENNIHFFAAGHHATERYGVQALGQHLADKFELDHLFIDINNPV